MRSSRLIIAIATVFALLATACAADNDTTPDDTPPDTTNGDAQPADPDPDVEDVTIRYFTFSAAPDHVATLDAMIAAFNEEYPHITVEVETAPFDDYFTSLRTQLAGRDAPDAFEVNYENFVSFAAAGSLADLDALSGGADASAYYPRAYEAFQYEGTQYGLPASYSTVLLVYNKALFDAAGVDHPTADWTWDDHKAAAAAINDPGNDVWGSYRGIHFWEFYKVAAQNGCEFFSGNEVTVDAPECVEALEHMVSFQDEGLQPTDAQMGGVSDGDMFVQGQIGMIVTGIWMFGAFADAPFDWDVVVEPGGASKATHFFSNGVAVSADSDKQEAAFQWASFMTGSPEAARIRVDASWELPTVADTSLFDSYLAQSPPDNRQAVLDSLNFAIVPPVIERQGEFQDGVNGLIERAKLGELSAAEALSQAKAVIEGLVD